MRSPAALAAVFLVLGHAAHAQRGGAARGGFAGRPAAPFGSSFAGARGPGGVRPGMGLPQYAGPFSSRAPFPASRFAYSRSYPRAGYPAGFSPMRSLYAPRSRPLYPYARGGLGFGGGVPVVASYGLPYPFLDSCGIDCDTSSADSLSAYADSASWAGFADAGSGEPPDPSRYGVEAAPDSGQPAYPDGPAYTGQSAYTNQPGYPSQPPYAGQPYAGQPYAASGPGVSVPLGRLQAAPAQEEVVTILFKDGRPPLQIRNYILTRSALYLAGEHFNEIPLAEIDLPATQQVNWNAGVTFRLP